MKLHCKEGIYRLITSTFFQWKRLWQSVSSWMLVLLGPIMRAIFAVLFRIWRFESIAVGTWKFFGPPEFIEIVREASARLENDAPELIQALTDNVIIFYNKEVPYSFPLWRLGAISDSFIRWKAEGVIAEWVYLYYHITAIEQRRRVLPLSENLLLSISTAKKNTHAWLTLYRYPAELIGCFD